MGKTLIKVDCVDQRLIVTSAPTVASGGKNEDEIEFNFCSKWDGFEKVGVFYRDIKDPHKATIDPTGRCVIPWEVLTSDGYIFIGAFGVKDDITRTTEILKYKVKLGAITEDLKPSDPTPELWEQILARVADKVNVKQGAEHAGKVLGIDEEGNVAPVDGGSGAILDPTLNEANQAAEAKAVGEALAKKVDAVEGMGLSSNDYTDDDKLAVEQNKIDIEDLKTDLDAFEKNRPFNLTGNPVQVESFEGMPLNPVTVLEPQQQGSGDPYPAGGGKNLLPITAKTQTINGVTFTVDNGVITVNGTASANAYLWLCDEFVLQPGTYVMSGIPDNFDYNTQGGFTDDNWSINRYGLTTLTEAKKVKPYIVVRSGVTANNVIFKLQLELGSTPTAFMPYANIRPIIGYDKLKLTATGKNLLDSSAVVGTQDGLTFSVNADGSITINGTAAASGARTISICELPVGDYVFSMRNNAAFSGSATVFCEGTSVDINLGYADASGAISGGSVAVKMWWNTGVVFNNFVIRLMIEPGSVASGFQPYTGSVYTVQIGQTVYGGRMDWLTGKLMVEFGCAAFDGSEPWQTTGWQNQHTYALWNFLPDAVDYGQAEIPDAYCSHFAANSVDGLFYNNVPGFTSFASGAVVFSSPAHASVEEFKAYLSAQSAAGTPVQIAYKLATPIEIQLEPHEINALQGVNTLYGDGKISISGRTDMQAVVSNLLKRIAMLESKANETE